MFGLVPHRLAIHHANSDIGSGRASHRDSAFAGCHVPAQPLASRSELVRDFAIGPPAIDPNREGDPEHRSGEDVGSGTESRPRVQLILAG
jgi:hypothetical protein